jgi:hypothetical protein
MPVLKNQRHELFCQAIVKGETISKAYENAGFRPNRANAARLKANEHIGQRVLELQAAAAASCEVTVASLLNELEQARAQATTLGQLSAAVRASAEKAKISGLLIERQEVKVVSEEYEPQSAVEVLGRICAKLGERPARALAEAFQIEYDECAIRAMCNAGNGSQPGYSQRLIEEQPIVNGRKRPIS